MEPSHSANEILDVAFQAAEAGAAVLRTRSDDALQAKNKSSTSDWVTAYDTAAERAAHETISRPRPKDIITGEEYGTSVPDGELSGVRWSIDPLDGTTNFVRNIVYYCVSVAAVTDTGQWLAGVVNAPALNRVYWAARGQGSWVRDGDSVRQLNGPPTSRTGTVVGTGFSYDRDQRSQQFSELSQLLEGHGDMRRLGSAALDLCMVADGTLDGYSERGLHEHDWAAGALIAEEAGVAVLRPGMRSAPGTGLSDQERFGAFTAAGPAALVDLVRRLER